MGMGNFNIMKTFIPPMAVWTSILAGFSITVFLLGFSRPPLRLPLFWRRYSAAVGAGLVIWGLLLWANGALYFNWVFERWLDLLAGVLIYLIAIFGNYYLGNVGGGFRIAMLLDLTAANRELTLEEWMGLYGEGRGMSYFLKDRLEATLLPWGLAVQDKIQVSLTPKGVWVGKVACFLASIFKAK